MAKLKQGTEHRDFRDTQLQFAAHIRHPEQNPPPPDIEDRRLAIYRDLFYNNIQSFLASGFPVLKSIFEQAHWHSMVRDFIYRHQSHSPYFLKISEEFLSYLQTERIASQEDPGFMLELAHYEWVELALDISNLEMPANSAPQGNMIDNIPQISPTAWRFNYRYPVKNIFKGCRIRAVVLGKGNDDSICRHKQVFKIMDKLRKAILVLTINTKNRHLIIV